MGCGGSTIQQDHELVLRSPRHSLNSNSTQAPRPRRVSGGSGRNSGVAAPAGLHIQRRAQPQRAGETVNDFLAERRGNRHHAHSDSGPRFNAYARYLGIDPTREEHLLWVARCSLYAPLPEGWTEHYDTHNRVFFYDSYECRSSWTHPLEKEHRSVHELLRQAEQSDGQRKIVKEAIREKLERLEEQVVAALDWIEYLDARGQVFYFNQVLKRSSWTDPAPAIRHSAIIWGVCLDIVDGRSCEDGSDIQLQDVPDWLRKLLDGGADSTAEIDHWKAPRVLLAERAYECPVCYEPLYTSKPSMLRRADTGMRLCGHYFCFSCAQRLCCDGTCPLCRAKAPGGCVAQALPDVEKAPRAWFHMVDNSNNGRLEREEVIRALEAVLPLDGERLRLALGVIPDSLTNSTRSTEGSDDGDDMAAQKSGFWLQWCSANDDTIYDGITEEEFSREGGLLQWIVENLIEVRRSAHRGAPPDLKEGHLKDWFLFWAASPAEGLARAEFLRALMRTLGVSGVERKKVHEIRSTIENCFSGWARDSDDRITLEAFLQSPGGLGETLLWALNASSEELAAAENSVAPPTSVVAAAAPDDQEDQPVLLRSPSFKELVRKLSILRNAPFSHDELATLRVEPEVPTEHPLVDERCRI